MSKEFKASDWVIGLLGFVAAAVGLWFASTQVDDFKRFTTLGATPYIDIGISTGPDQDFVFYIVNRGANLARMKVLSFTYLGKPYNFNNTADIFEFAKALKVPSKRSNHPPPMTTKNVPPIIPPGHRVDIIRVDKSYITESKRMAWYKAWTEKSIKFSSVYLDIYGHKCTLKRGSTPVCPVHKRMLAEAAEN